MIQAIADLAMPEIQPTDKFAGKDAFRVAGQVFASLALVAVITFIFSRLIPVNATTTGFFYLVAILMIASYLGAGGIDHRLDSGHAVLQLLLSSAGRHVHYCRSSKLGRAVCLPGHIVDGQPAFGAGQTANQEAIDRQHEMERLYSLSRGLLLTDPARPTPSRSFSRSPRTFEFPAVLSMTAAATRSIAPRKAIAPDIDAKLRESTMRSTSFRDERRRFTIVPIRLGGEPIGSLAMSRLVRCRTRPCNRC